MRTIFLICLLLISAVIQASSPEWRQFKMDLRKEALSEGIRAGTFDRAFQDVHEPSRRVLTYDRTQPEKRLTFLKYRNTRADAYRIKIGHKKFKMNQKLLEQIGSEYGVHPCFITSLWGLETSYGHFMGKFPVIQSLATLAFDSRRSSFFRKELLIALHILNDGHVDLKNFKGEWAGATGQPQFLPSSWKKFAVDYSKNGRKDIWNDKSDIFASIANYLQLNGWHTQEPWAIEVQLPSAFDQKLLTRKIKKQVNEWMSLGIMPMNHATPNAGLDASVIEPYGGPVMMVFNNFNVIMKWNHSTYYAGTVGYLAEKICRHKL